MDALDPRIERKVGSKTWKKGGCVEVGEAGSAKRPSCPTENVERLGINELVVMLQTVIGRKIYESPPQLAREV